MTDDGKKSPERPKKLLSPAAKRALEEAEMRRKQAQGEAAAVEETGGPKGLEPTRYGDWERKGVTYDF